MEEFDQYLLFDGVVEIMGDGTDEGSVMMVCIELGRCTLVGFPFTPVAELQIPLCSTAPWNSLLL